MKSQRKQEKKFEISEKRTEGIADLKFRISKRRIKRDHKFEIRDIRKKNRKTQI